MAAQSSEEPVVVTAAARSSEALVAATAVACTGAPVAAMAEACTAAAKAAMAEAYTSAATAETVVACIEAPMAATVAMAAAYTGAARVAMAAECTWGGLDFGPVPARCAGLGGSLGQAFASAEWIAQREQTPLGGPARCSDGLVRCTKSQAQACWLASPDSNLAPNDCPTAFPGLYRPSPAACLLAREPGCASWSPPGNRGAMRRPWPRRQELGCYEPE
jgi:hypothetical protein